MRSVMVVCALARRFALIAALEDREAMLTEPVALAPEAGRRALIGDVSPAAEAFGVVAGMAVGEALIRCPQLRLVPPDPERARALWAAALDRLEQIGAQPESDREGEAYFDAGGLRGLHGGHLEGVLLAARRAIGPRIRLGAAPSRFASYAAALATRPRRSQVVAPAAVRAFLAPLPVAILRARAELAGLPDMLERLGVRTLGALAQLPTPAVAERFGHPGLLALELAQGRDTPLAPRRPSEPVSERIVLPDAGSGAQLERALELLIARLLARPERRGRSVRSLALSARFVEGGTWRARSWLREASADPARLALALAPRLAELPAPVESIAIEVEAFGPPAHAQGRLIEDSDAALRRSRIGEAVRQVRRVTGEDAIGRVLDLDPGSRIPERRSALAPFPDQ